ncbi:hypothetical protein K461DRAFT_214343, partial [Myriangium duriaei CBS 260.36]
LPKILCLHGGGTNAAIFHRQMRCIIRSLSSHFTFVFVDAPHPSPAGPDVLSVYKDWGPFRQWLQWHPQWPLVDGQDDIKAAERLEKTVREVVVEQRDRSQGRGGDWVGVLGFSQGAKIAASILYETERRGRDGKEGFAGVDWRFGILLAGRAPLVALGDWGSVEEDEYMDLPGECCPPPMRRGSAAGNGKRVGRPTLHVHGSKDRGVELHRALVEGYCEKGSAEVLEWEGEHRVPFKRGDVERVVKGILRTAE